MNCEICGTRTEPGAKTGWYRCPECGHAAVAGEPVDTRGHAWGGNSLFDRIRLRAPLRRIRSMLPAERAGAVLELGFGAGRLLVKLSAEGHEAHGVERHLLEQTVPADLAAAATLHNSTIEAVELPSARFDVAYAIHVIEHVDDPRVMLRKMHDALRPGGRVLLHTPDAKSAGIRVFRAAWWNFEDPTHVRFFSPESMRRLLSEVGFERIAIRKPWGDSLMIEPLSLIRALARKPREHGVMSSRPALLAGLLLLPLTALVRWVWPALRPTLEITAERPG